MPVVYPCPHCRNPVTVPDAVLGQVIGCPHCGHPFQPMPVPAQPAPPAFDLNDAEPTEAHAPDDFAALGRGGPRRRARPRPPARAPLSTRFAAVFAVLGGAVMMLVNQSTRRPGKGFDPKEIAISAVVGAVCAALGFLVGKMFEGPADPRQARDRRRD